MVRDVAAEPGARAAREHYGARGWVLHQNTDIWRAAAPMDGPTWGAWHASAARGCAPTSGSTIASPATSRRSASIYPVIKGATQFFLDTLVPHPSRAMARHQPLQLAGELPRARRQRALLRRSERNLPARHAPCAPDRRWTWRSCASCSRSSWRRPRRSAWTRACAIGRGTRAAGWRRLQIGITGQPAGMARGLGRSRAGTPPLVASVGTLPRAGD